MFSGRGWYGIGYPPLPPTVWRPAARRYPTLITEMGAEPICRTEARVHFVR